MKYRAILFDLDGTLLDTLDDLADSMNAVLANLGCPQHPADSYRYFVGDGVIELVRRVLPPDQCNEPMIQQAAKAMREEYSRRWNCKTRPYPGIPELLNAIAASGIAMGVFSNKPDDFTKLCVGKLLGNWTFKCVKGLDDSIKKKPDPSGALHIAAAMGIPAEDFLYLGDTNTDMKTAVAAGMYPVGALWGFRTAEELLSSGAKQLIAQPASLLSILMPGA